MHTNTTVNGIDVEALKKVAGEVAEDPTKGMVGFRVTSHWAGGTKTQSTVNGYTMAGREIEKSFQIEADEPQELLGENTAPNPQELLMAAFNSCMMVGYIAGAAMEGINLEKCEIHTEGELDLRGFLGLDNQVRPGYEHLRYTVTIKGDGTAEQFEAIHQNVIRTSPNRWNLANDIRLESRLITEPADFST